MTAPTLTLYLLKTPFGEERYFSKVKDVVKLDKAGPENVIFKYGSEKIT